MPNDATHLSPKPFLTIHEARAKLDAASGAIIDAQCELTAIERRAEALLLSDQDARDLLADLAANHRAKQLHLAEHGFHAEGLTAEVRASWSALCRESDRIEKQLLVIGDNFDRARAAMAARVAEEAQRGRAA